MRNERLRQLIAQNAAIQEKDRPQLKGASSAAGIEVLIYDVIDPWFGVSAKAFADAIAGSDALPLTVRINSPGGDVFEGRAIASMIRARKGPTKCVVDGLAASAASTIAVAAKETVMAMGSFLMVHCAWAFAMDDAEGLRELADLLDKVDGQIAADYAAKAGCTLEQAVAWMAAETWFTADEAVAAGLAESVLSDAAQMKAFNLGAFEHAPKALINSIAALNDNEQAAMQMRDNAVRRLQLYG